MEKDWVKVYSSDKLYKAELLKGILADNDIPSVIVNKQDSSYIVIGVVELYVNQDNVMRAINLIRKTEL